MSSSTFNNIVKGVFLFAYAAFLTASITHIAFFFHGFEPQSAPAWLQEWGIPYGLAIAIDVTNVVMMIGVTFRKGTKASGRRTGIWIFIGMLTLFSWVANWEYALEFQSSALSRAASETIPLTGITFYQLNPILASSFAFLNLAYSLAAELFNSNPKTAEELTQEADRLEALEEAQKRIDTYHERNKKASLVKRLGASIREARDEAKQVFRAAQNVSQIETNDDAKESELDQQSDEQNTVLEGVLAEVKTEESNEQKASQMEAVDETKVPQPELQSFAQNGVLEACIPEGKTEERDDENGSQMEAVDEAKGPDSERQSDEQNESLEASRKEIKTVPEVEARAPDAALSEDVLAMLKTYPGVNSWLSASQRTATVEEIASVTGRSKRVIQNRVNDGTLKRTPRNANLILITSVIAWLKTVSPPRQDDAIPREQSVTRPIKSAG